MTPSLLTFKPIDLARHGQQCIDFREDTFLLALGHARPLHGEDGKGTQRFLDWLDAQQAKLPGSMLHAWLGEELVGQLEMSVPEPQVGYIHLFYLVSSKRHLGLGQQLHDHALGFLGACGCTRLRLAASPSNAPALRFYQRNGWQDVGPDPRSAGVNRYERLLA